MARIFILSLCLLLAIVYNAREIDGKALIQIKKEVIYLFITIINLIFMK